MKKNRLLFVLVAICTFILTGCEKENSGPYIIIDWAPVEIYIYADDADGNSIIRPDMPGMELTFKGETYTVRDKDQLMDSIYTRAYMATLFGLYAERDSERDSTAYRLYFGEIDGAADMDEDIVLKWPDGSKDVIHYHCSDHKYGKEAKCNRSWKLNGQKNATGSRFYFTGKSLE